MPASASAKAAARCCRREREGRLGAAADDGPGPCLLLAGRKSLDRARQRPNPLARPSCAPDHPAVRRRVPVSRRSRRGLDRVRRRLRSIGAPPSVRDGRLGGCAALRRARNRRRAGTRAALRRRRHFGAARTGPCGRGRNVDGRLRGRRHGRRHGGDGPGGDCHAGEHAAVRRRRRRPHRQGARAHPGPHPRTDRACPGSSCQCGCQAGSSTTVAAGRACACAPSCDCEAAEQGCFRGPRQD